MWNNFRRSASHALGRVVRWHPRHDPRSCPQCFQHQKHEAVALDPSRPLRTQPAAFLSSRLARYSWQWNHTGWHTALEHGLRCRVRRVFTTHDPPSQQYAEQDLSDMLSRLPRRSQLVVIGVLPHQVHRNVQWNEVSSDLCLWVVSPEPPPDAWLRWCHPTPSLLSSSSSFRPSLHHAPRVYWFQAPNADEVLQFLQARRYRRTLQDLLNNVPQSRAWTSTPQEPLSETYFGFGLL